ncbi:CapA family protein, partial [Vibrio alginolyticus]|uniref:CapA family protein n=1 Tax=Vibrio alginolyticus TaxID=663 RepID=UPI00354DD394
MSTEMESKMNFIGDVFLDRVHNKIPLKNYICNLEYPITIHDEAIPGKVNLKADKGYYLETFGQLPIAVSLANNHIFDFGKKGALDTIDYLNSKNIKYCGLGNSNNNYNNPCYLEALAEKIALLSYCCLSTNPGRGDGDLDLAIIEEDKIIKDIILAKNNSSKIILLLHWGDEECFLPKPEDVKLARRLIAAGADMIIGHHAHIIQSHEIYKGKDIYYGLGNSVFPDLDTPSYFDCKGVSNYRFIKEQRSWNKNGLLLSLDSNFNVTNHLMNSTNSNPKISDVKYFPPSLIVTNDAIYKIIKDFKYRSIMIM